MQNYFLLNPSQTRWIEDRDEQAQNFHGPYILEEGIRKIISDYDFDRLVSDGAVWSEGTLSFDEKGLPHINEISYQYGKVAPIPLWANVGGVDMYYEYVQEILKGTSGGFYTLPKNYEECRDRLKAITPEMMPW